MCLCFVSKSWVDGVVLDFCVFLSGERHGLFFLADREKLTSLVCAIVHVRGGERGTEVFHNVCSMSKPIFLYWLYPLDLNLRYYCSLWSQGVGNMKF